MLQINIMSYYSRCRSVDTIIFKIMNTKDQMMSNEYLSSLVKLTSKCDRTIEALTALAKQNIVHASIIVDTIAKHINNDEVNAY